jgi:hypothetical protein
LTPDVKNIFMRDLICHEPVVKAFAGGLEIDMPRADLESPRSIHRERKSRDKSLTSAT